ncbi:hypothetical protein [Streptomyces sp. NPDC001530]|uniref:hypothetical protein n=1 Tax=Streptomyces sp. NPDC001530 TaxID=3364582 RepID=UPI0036A2575B
MSRGEETDEPITGDEHLVPGEPVDLSRPEPAGNAPEPSPFLAVVISGDGSAAIDGVPVPTAEGEAVDAAVLDTLHGYARDRNATVTAAISDPASGYVAFVEVAPDGSSTLLEQHGEQPPEQGEPAVPTGPYGHETGTGPSGVDDDVDEGLHDDPEDELEVEVEVDEAAYALPQPSGSPSPPPAFSSTRASASPANPSRSPIPRPEIGRRGELRQSDAEFEEPGLLHRPLVVGPAALGVAALVIVPLVMLGSGGSGGGGDETQAARATSEASKSPSAEEPAPTVSVTPSMMPSPPSATPTKPKDTQGSKGSKGSKGGGSVTVTVTARPPRTTVTAKPPQDTAATAVRRLARSDPGGRHICYRVYLSGQGWQKPVCDGTLAGTTGQNKPIKSINIAVTGSGGSAANAFVHDAKSTSGQGRWEPQWTAIVGNGKNNYIGSTSKSAPYMTGFAINIGSGQVCEIAKVHGYAWGGQGCADARPDFVFGGTLENTRWLEAVKFTV